MKKLFPETPDVPQGVANRGVRIIEKHLRMHKVDRAKDLPEEAKVRLLRDLRIFFESEGRDKTSKTGPKGGQRGFWARLWERMENFLSFSDSNTTTVLCTSGTINCILVPRMDEN